MALTVDFSALPYFLLFALACGCACDRWLRVILAPERPPHTAAISVLVAAVFFCVYGLSVTTLQSWLLCQVLLFAGAYDLTTHTVPDYIHILLLFVGLAQMADPLASAAGFLLAPLPLLLGALLSPGSVGGADIKLMAAVGVTLGPRRGMGALAVGLLLAVLINGAYGKGRKEPFPLVPYLGLGCFLALLA